MSNYRRLISYIYAYEGTVKGKNIGFAKLESRNGQCRISVSVKKVYVGGNDMGVYLLSDGGEILLGKIFIRSGAGEFRTAVKSDDVEESGKSLENCYGLTVHDMQDDWRSYTTIWDDGIARETGDAVAHAAEVELAAVTSETLRKSREEAEEGAEMTTFQLLQTPPPDMDSGSGQWEFEEKFEEKIPAPPESVGQKEPDSDYGTENMDGEGKNGPETPAAFSGNSAESTGFGRMGMMFGGGMSGIFSAAPERWSVGERGTGSPLFPRFLIRDRQVSGYMSGAGSVRQDVNQLRGGSWNTAGDVPERKILPPGGVPGTADGAEMGRMEPGKMPGSELNPAAPERTPGGMLTPELVPPTPGGMSVPELDPQQPGGMLVPELTPPSPEETPGPELVPPTPGGTPAPELDPQPGEMPLPEINPLPPGTDPQPAPMPARPVPPPAQTPAAPSSQASVPPSATPGGARPPLRPEASRLEVPRSEASNSESRPEMPRSGALNSEPRPEMTRSESSQPQPSHPEASHSEEPHPEVSLPEEPAEEPEENGPLDPVPDAETVWNSFRKQYPKIDAFDYENGCEILKIRPQDIGLLPRENWMYGNNSFLLHGYYNYRCLILVRLNNPGGKSRFLLGVPGHYFSNEKYMASMFGFPHFVLSKRQPLDNGRFGYWYTDVRLGQ